MEEKDTRVLVPVAVKEIKRGTGKTGEWVLSAVKLATEDGEALEQEYTTFDQLEEGKPVEVELSVNEKDGKTYHNLKVKKASMWDEIRDIKKRLDALEGKDVTAKQPSVQPAKKDGLDDIPF